MTRYDKIHGPRWLLCALIASPWWVLGRDWWVIDGRMWFFVVFFLTVYLLPRAILHDKQEAQWVRKFREAEPEG